MLAIFHAYCIVCLLFFFFFRLCAFWLVGIYVVWIICVRFFIGCNKNHNLGFCQLLLRKIFHTFAWWKCVFSTTCSSMFEWHWSCKVQPDSCTWKVTWIASFFLLFFFNYFIYILKIALIWWRSNFLIVKNHIKSLHCIFSDLDGGYGFRTLQLVPAVTEMLMLASFLSFFFKFCLMTTHVDLYLFVWTGYCGLILEGY